MTLSIITINLNNRDGLAETIASVQSQTFRNFEHIIIDGASTDGSLRIINENKQYLAHWESEQDNGIYHAMNKGISLASGEYLQFLNSGDCLVTPDILEKVFGQEGAGADLVYGHTLRKNDLPKPRVRHAPSHLTMFSYLELTTYHQSIFFKNSLFRRHGNYDETFKLAGDYEFILRCLNAGATSQIVDMVVSAYEGGGLSETSKKTSLAEMQKVHELYFSDGIWDCYKHFQSLARENANRKRAEEWIAETKTKPLWSNLALVCGWWRKRRQ